MEAKEQIRREIDARRQNMVNEMIGHPMDREYYWLKGAHDAYVDLLTYIDYHVKI